jgi:hypothetical protein
MEHQRNRALRDREAHSEGAQTGFVISMLPHTLLTRFTIWSARSTQNLGRGVQIRFAISMLPSEHNWCHRNRVALSWLYQDAPSGFRSRKTFFGYFLWSQSPASPDPADAAGSKSGKSNPRRNRAIQSLHPGANELILTSLISLAFQNPILYYFLCFSSHLREMPLLLLSLDDNQRQTPWFIAPHLIRRSG